MLKRILSWFSTDSDTSVPKVKTLTSSISELSLDEKEQRLETVNSSNSLLESELDKLRSTWGKLNMIYQASKNKTQRKHLYENMCEIEHDMFALIHKRDLVLIEKDLLENELAEEEENMF